MTFKKYFQNVASQGEIKEIAGSKKKRKEKKEKREKMQSLDFLYFFLHIVLRIGISSKWFGAFALE